MPVFFIQDGIKFPDLVHAIKPQPHHEMPQASAAIVTLDGRHMASGTYFYVLTAVSYQHVRPFLLTK